MANPQIDIKPSDVRLGAPTVNEKGSGAATASVEPPAPSKKDILTEIGGTGTIIVGGIISMADYNPDLTGTKRIAIFDQMRLGDASVRAALLAVKLPILAANWYIEPASDSAQDTEIADFVEDCLFNQMELSWNDFLRQCLMHLDYGSAVFEKVFKLNETGQIIWQKFAPRLSKTIYRWRLQDGITKGVTQILPTGGLREIPDWKILMFVNEQEGENYEGISLLRPAYKHWYMKDKYYQTDAIATERQGVGVPIVTIPPSANATDRAKIEELLQNMRTNEASYIEVPMGWTVGMMDMKAGTNVIKSVKDMILHHDREITKSVLAQFLELGGTNSGSFALSANQSELFLLSLQAVSKHIQEVINEGAIKELVDLNYNVTEYPKLEVGRIGTVDFEKISTALYRLALGGLIKADQPLEEYIRNMMELPEAVQSTEDEFENPDATPVDVPTTGPVVIQKTKEAVGEQTNPDNAGKGTNVKASEFLSRKRFIEDMEQLNRELEAMIHEKTK
jgi:hypothetical protein